MMQNPKNPPMSAKDAVWPAFLSDPQAIASYISELAPYEVDEEMIEELYRGCHGRLVWIELDSLVLANSDHHLSSKSRQRKVDSLPVNTMPPLVVDRETLRDGYHRLRKLKQEGITHHWIYVIEAAPEPAPAPSASEEPRRKTKPSRWDALYDLAR